MSKQNKEKIEQVLAPLRALYPNTFFGWEQPCFPLKIGIDRDILEVFPELSKKRLQMALRAYINQASYSEAVLAGKPRVDLSGKPIETTTERHRHIAFVNKFLKKSRTRDPSARFELRQRMISAYSRAET